VRKRLLATPSQFANDLKKGIGVEWSLATGHIVTIRGGGSDSDGESEVHDEGGESGDEYDSEEEEYDTESEDEYDSEEEDEDQIEVIPTSLKSSVLSKSKDDASGVVEYDDMLTPPSMQHSLYLSGS